jgi:hypothetical protein
VQRKKLVVMGFMGSCPIAGVVWQHLHYIIGLQRLGHEVFYVEDSARLPYNPITREAGTSPMYAAEFLAQLASDFGFERRWSYCARYFEGMPTIGLPRVKVQQLYRDADAILNVCGAQEFHEDLLVSERLFYVESDPGLEQIHVDQERTSTIDYLKRHRALFTFGENVGTSSFPVPAHGFTWLPTRQPIVTDLWRTNELPPNGAVFSSVVNWSTVGAKDIEWAGEKYLWSKSEEFLRFIDAPVAAGEPFELAVNMEEPALRVKFEANGWRLREPWTLSADLDLYRDYIQEAKGEFTVAKDQYVRLRTGWFSDRSACYLAAGRPVITQETGFTQYYGNGVGLLPFRSLGEVAEAVKMINADYTRHSRAAAEIAREHFEAEKVLRDLLDRAGI